ncbi:unnamed protein product [Ilex paraguariensis]|uniref:Uncharacterized protein n=1 Tax=Ilex paraguariensis TaxID=185542 RepID=A0ABC8QUE2_9AQUA
MIPSQLFSFFDGPLNTLVVCIASTADASIQTPKFGILWVVEGSDDGGSTWRVLDKQTSQMFTKRFQRKTFEIQSQGVLSNAFRLSFLAVRDKQATSRFQIGSIDLFARSQGNQMNSLTNEAYEETEEAMRKMDDA